MASTEYVDPIIVVGMHRSGTSVVTETLRSIGVHFGSIVDPHSEARIFQRLNAFAMHHCGGDWDNPSPALFALGNSIIRKNLSEFFARKLGGPDVIGLVGASAYAKGARAFRSCRPWGWKDPRTTVLLPVWLDLFPGAKVIHVVRHGVDVASSLNARMMELIDQPIGTQFTHQIPFYFRTSRSNPDFSPRCARVSDAFELWVEYMAIAEQHLAEVTHYVLRYEDLMMDPEPRLRSLCSFIELQEPSAAFQRISSLFLPARAFAHRRDAELSRFAKKVQHQLGRFGYE